MFIDYPEYVARFARIDCPVSVVYRFGILARSGEGKFIQYSTNLQSG